MHCFSKLAVVAGFVSLVAAGSPPTYGETSSSAPVDPVDSTAPAAYSSRTTSKTLVSPVRNTDPPAYTTAKTPVDPEHTWHRKPPCYGGDCSSKKSTDVSPASLVGSSSSSLPAGYSSQPTSAQHTDVSPANTDDGKTTTYTRTSHSTSTILQTITVFASSAPSGYSFSSVESGSGRTLTIDITSTSTETITVTRAAGSPSSVGSLTGGVTNFATDAESTGSVLTAATGSPDVSPAACSTGISTVTVTETEKTTVTFTPAAESTVKPVKTHAPPSYAGWCSSGFASWSRSSSAPADPITSQSPPSYASTVSVAAISSGLANPHYGTSSFSRSKPFPVSVYGTQRPL